MTYLGPVLLTTHDLCRESTEPGASHNQEQISVTFIPRRDVGGNPGEAEAELKGLGGCKTRREDGLAGEDPRAGSVSGTKQASPRVEWDGCPGTRRKKAC